MDRAERARLHRVSRSQDCLVVEVWGEGPAQWEGFAMAQRDPDGAVTLAIYARECRDAGFPAASGGLAFELLLGAAKEERPVPAILGEWHPTSDNFREFKRLRSIGATADAAALATFTGSNAAHHGYAAVARLEEQDHLVRVRFELGARR